MKRVPLAPRAEAPALEIARLVVEEHVDAPRVPRLYSVRTIAARGDWSGIHVRRAIREGRLRAYTVAGTIRVLEEDLVRWLVNEGLPPDVILRHRDAAGDAGAR